MSLTLPAGSCNAHCHVFGPRDRFPYPAGLKFSPAPDAPKEELFALNDSLGLERCVVVQSARHGLDNRATEDAVVSRPETYRGVALLAPAVSDAELARLDKAGFCGVRFNFIGHLGPSTPIAEVMALTKRLVPFGWHLQVYGEASMLSELGPHFKQSPVPVVIDHIGRVDASAGIEGRDFHTLLRLMDDPKFWVKVAGMDRITKFGPPYLDAQPLARKLISDFGDRVVWGNDWPHPNHQGPVPNLRQLVDLIWAIAPDPAAREKLMVANPAKLYRFGALA